MKHEDCWIQTYTGKQFFPYKLTPDQFDILDIAHALSMICRFNGHCLDFYSVAQHSVYVMQVVEQLGGNEDQIKWALMHDTAEAYTGDRLRPIKSAQDHILEYNILCDVAEWLDLSPPLPLTVKMADLMMLSAEADQIMAPHPVPWRLDVQPASIKVYPVGPEEAKKLFLEQFKRLFP